MGEGELNQLLEDSFEFDFGTARELSSTLLDWIDADDQMRLNGAESAQYLRRNPPYRAANAPLQTLGELRLLEGWGELFFTEDGSPNEAFQRLEAMVSVVNGDSVNLNSSTEPTLRHLSPGEGDDFERLFDGLRDEPYLKTVPGSLQSNRAGVTAELLRITITVRRGEVPFNLSALVEPNIGAEAGPAPAVRSDDQPRTGAPSEQEAIAYPFTILQLSEHEGASPPAAPARYSALDIEKQSDSF
jgi:general secretion pathway protein K